MGTTIYPGFQPDGKLRDTAATVKRNIAADLNNAFVNVLHYKDSGSGGGGLSEDSIIDGATDTRDVFVAADAAGKPICVPAGTYLISANLTISNQLCFAAGAKLKPANGVTITISSDWVAGDMQQIFDLSLGGSVSAPSVPYVAAPQFGTGHTAINAALAASSNVVVPTASTFATTDTITVPTGKTLRVDGTINHTSSNYCLSLAGTLISSPTSYGGSPTGASTIMLSTVSGLSADDYISVNVGGIQGTTYKITATNTAKTVTFDNTTDLVTASTDHGFTDGMPIQFRDGGSATIPTGLAFNTVYYVRDITGTTQFKVAATPGGTAINFTDDGAGTITTAAYVTTQRPLDFTISADATATCFSAATGTITGKGTINTSTVRPSVIFGQYVKDFHISDVTINSLTEFAVDGTVISTVKILNGVNVSVKNLHLTGITGGYEFEPIRVGYCAQVTVEGNTIADSFGMSKGIFVSNSSRVNVTNNQLPGTGGGNVGCIFLYGVTNYTCSSNIVTDPQVNATYAGSPIQMTTCYSGTIFGNVIRNVRGPGGIYVSGGCKDLTISNNQITINDAGASGGITGIHLRSGNRITCTGNSILATRSAVAGIWVRGIDEFTLTGNMVSLVPVHAGAAMVPLYLDKGTDAIDPSNGIVTGNSFIKENCNPDSSAVILSGTTASNIRIENNYIKLTSATNSTSTTKWCVLLQGSNIAFNHNQVVCTFDTGGGGTNKYLFQSTCSGELYYNRFTSTGANANITLSGSVERHGLGNNLNDTYYYDIKDNAAQLALLSEQYHTLNLLETGTAPISPLEGHAVFWMSNGSSGGADGDILAKVTAAAATKTYNLTSQWRVDALGNKTGATTLAFGDGKGYTKSLTATGDVALTLTATLPGYYTAEVVQDGTGGRAVTYTTTVQGFAPAINNIAGTKTIIPLFYDGTTWFHVGRPTSVSETLSENNATPSVSSHSQLYITNNTSSTSITGFTGMTVGQQWLLGINDSNTTLDCTTNLINIAGASDITPADNDYIRCTALSGSLTLVEHIDAT